MKQLIKILPFLALFIFSCEEEKPAYEYPYLDPSLTPEARAADLVGRMTLEEKVSQTINEAPAIERLGVPEYNWWNEGLHGVARAGLATVFPQAIGLSATWDEEHMFEVATAISDEARAKHHDFVKSDKRFLYQGLTFWSPNINIFRDPRWGRGQETYGEDPFLSGRLAVNFIKGMQGDDPKYFKTIATVKHFAVHNGPEHNRHTFDVQPTQRDFYETYLPQFEMGIKEGGAYSAMCAYNRLDGEACCGSDRLMNKILREDWGFEGYIVSDCGAILDIHENHKITATPEESAALGIKSGCDLNCGKIYNNLTEAVKQGLISEKEIDKAVERLFVARFKLGMFDPPEMVKYANISYEVVDSEKHRKLALETARKSMVLLKNDGTLPLSKDLKNIAVIGPNSDQWLMLLGNYNGVPADPVTPLRGIQEKLPEANVMFAQGCELSGGIPMLYPIPAEVISHDGQPGFNVDYYNDHELKGEILYSETMPNLDVNWQDKAPREDMDDDNFGVRWSGEITPDLTGEYQIGVISTSDTKVYLNDSLIASTPYHFRNEYGDPRTRKSDYIHLAAGEKYKLEVTAGETYADAQIQLVWAKPKPNLKKEALAVAQKADVVVMCMGLTARIEGEEMDVKVDGFFGGDRTRIDLPDVQQELIKEIRALGKPVVLVLMNGGALAINWEDENIPAILEAWYPGQAGGTAIADILFGDYNPSGRLPVTFYKSVDDLPDFEDYNMTSQTYRYFQGEPLYPFGYGLSYTSFSYENLQMPAEVKAGEGVKISVSVKNTGDVAGDEIVQVYVSAKDAPQPSPLRQLRAFDRVTLQPGESKTVEFTLPASAFSILDENNERVVLPGNFEVSIGGGQPEAKGAKVQVGNLVLK